MKEIWRKIPVEHFGEVVEASTYGRIRNIDRFITDKRGSERFYEGQILVPTPNKKGYLQVSLCYKGRLKTGYVAILIAKTFIPNQKNNPEVNHKNGIKSDCSVGNLEWVTCLENTQHAIKTGLRDTRGGKNGKSKLTDKQIKQIRKLYKQGKAQASLAEQFGVGQSNIWSIVNFKTWKHIQ